MMEIVGHVLLMRSIQLYYQSTTINALGVLKGLRAKLQCHDAIRDTKPNRAPKFRRSRRVVGKGSTFTKSGLQRAVSSKARTWGKYEHLKQQRDLALVDPKEGPRQ